MQTIQDNIQELTKIINEEAFDKSVAMEFLEAISTNVEDLNETIDDTKSEVTEKEDQIRQLEHRNDELEESPDFTTIECGIGKIEYAADNLQLEQLMETLSECIEKYNSKEVLSFLTEKMKLPYA